MDNLLNKIPTIIISLMIWGIVIKNSNGRVSKSRYRKVETFMLIGLISYCALIVFLKTHQIQIFGFNIIHSIELIIFFFKYYQLQILRFRDLNYSPWFALTINIPFVNLYFLWVKYTKERNQMINKFDESIDCLKFLKKTDLYPNRYLINLNEMNFSVNEINFEYRDFNGKNQYEVSKMSLEQDKKLENFLKNNFEITENAPCYASNYKISFLDNEKKMIDAIKTNFNAVIQKEGFIKFDDIDVFIRKNFGAYEIVYSKEFVKMIKQYEDIIIINGMCSQTLNKSQLKNFLEEIK